MTSLEAFYTVAKRGTSNRFLFQTQIDELTVDDWFLNVMTEHTQKIKHESDLLQAVAKLQSVLHLGILMGLEMGKS